MKKPLLLGLAGLIGSLLLLAGCDGVRFGGANFELVKVDPTAFQVKLQGSETGIAVSSDQLTATFKLVGPSPGVTLTSAKVQFVGLDGKPIAGLDQVTRASLRIGPVDRDKEQEVSYVLKPDFKGFAQYWLGVARAQVEQGQAVPYSGWQVKVLFEAVDDNGHRYPLSRDISLDVALENITLGEAPRVVWVAPAQDEVVKGSVLLRVDATDDTEVRRVVFYANENLIGEDTDGTDGYAVTWDTTAHLDGKVTLKAEAFDVAGNKGEATIQVTVANADAEAPQVVWSAPASGVTLSGVVELRASATDDRGVVRVAFYANGNLVGEDTDGTDGYAVTWDTTAYPDGEVALKAEAFDAAGNKGEATVQVALANDPRVEWVKLADASPVPGMRLAGLVDMNVGVDAPRGVDRVIFVLRSSESGEATIAEGALAGDYYHGSFRAQRYEKGSYELVARVYDMSGASAEQAIQVSFVDPLIITTPQEGDKVGPNEEVGRSVVAITVGLNGTVYGELGSISSVTVYINGKEQGNAEKVEGSDDVAYVYAWDTTQTSDGHDPTKSGDRVLTAKITTADGTEYLTPGVLVQYVP